jgi:serine/threonine-protein kinase
MSADGSRFCASCGTGLLSGEDPLAPGTVADEPRTELRKPNAPPSSDPSSDEWRFAPGALLGNRYRIVAFLGRGGMGEVYRAIDLKLGQAVALKFLPEGLDKDDARQARFFQEVRIARQISHPNICRVYDVSEAQGYDFLSMEFIDGEDLASLLRRIGRLPQDKALQIARQLCAGLGAAHEQGVLHRDLKPANVMIDGRGRARIMDFGLAGLLEQLQGEDTRAGTPAYMAPEQLAGEQLTIRTDIYALGLVLYEVFTGRPAFESSSLAEMLRLKRSSSMTIPSGHVDRIDPHVERVIMRCLAADPAQRPASALAVAAALPGGDPLSEALAMGETPSPEEVAEAGQRESVRPPVAWTLLAFNIIGLLLIVLFGNEVEFHKRLPPAMRPEVLADRAVQMIRGFGYTTAPKDEAFGFDYDHKYIRYMFENGRMSELWDASESPWAVRFWYRQSSEYLVSERRVDELHEHWARTFVTYTDPPALLSGMVAARLDVHGRLLEFQAVPSRSDPGTESPELDWSPVFAAADLAPEEWVPTESQDVPPVASDFRVAWKRRESGAVRNPVRLEAAAHRGRPVYFKAVGAWDPLEAQAISAWSIPKAVVFAIWVVAFVGSLFFGVRHWRSRKADRAGVLRLTALVFGIAFLSWLFESSHVPHGYIELELFLFGVALGLQSGIRYGLMYAAVDPYFRRLWPQSLIPWTRLLSGRLRDPLVGRDVLVGLAFGMATYLLGNGALLFGSRDSMMPVLVDLQPLLSPRYVLVNVLTSCQLAIFIGLECAVVFLLLRVLLRNQWLAALVVFLLALGAYSTNLTTLYSTIMLILAAAIFTYVLVRFGLLALIAHLFIGTFASMTPFTLDASSWYAGTSTLGIAAVAAVILYAFVICFSGRSPLRGEFLKS